jgi:hypothetical protein
MRIDDYMNRTVDAGSPKLAAAARTAITIPQARVLELLKGTVTHSLEGGNKGSKFPTFHAYFEMDGDDVPKETVRKLRDEFVLIKAALNGAELGLLEGDNFVPVSKVSGMLRASNPDAGIFLRNVGLPHDFDAGRKVEETVNTCIEMCDEAIRRDCGFGKYTTPPAVAGF